MDDPLEKWFAEEVLVHEPALMRYLRRMWPNREELTDLRQELYVRVFESAMQALPASPKAFLFTTLRNLMIDRMRRNRIVFIGAQADLDELNVLVDEVSPEHRTAAVQELGALARALDSLPPRCRRVMWLRKVERLSQREVAARLGIGEGAVEKQVARGMRMLAKAWQGQHTAHRVAVIRLRTVWHEADRLQVLGAGLPEGGTAGPERWRSGAAPASLALQGSARPAAWYRRRLFWPALAACVAVVVVLAGIGWHRQAMPVYRTQVGGIVSVPLSDGSRLTLNTDSRVRLRWNEGERRVVLERGEAYFEVAKDSRRPFVVEAGDTRVVAVGTRFSVRRDAGDVQVVVTEGQIHIEGKVPGSAGTPVVPLGAGGWARVGGKGVVTGLDGLARSEERLSWRSGYLVFEDTPLAEVAAEFNRYNRRQLVVSDPSLLALRIGGNLRADNLEAFVRVLERGFPVRAIDEGERVVLVARP